MRTTKTGSTKPELSWPSGWQTNAGSGMPLAHESLTPPFLLLFSPSMAATLGALPTAHELLSVPLLAGHHAGPLSTTAAAPGITTTHGPQHIGLATPTHPQQGLLLSPASEPFPQKLVDKIRSGQFVDMKELLADNMSLIKELEEVQGLPSVQCLGSRRPRMREISSLPAWCYCFLGYMAICTTDPTTRDQLAYARPRSPSPRGAWLARLRSRIPAASSRRPLIALEYTCAGTAGIHHHRPTDRAGVILYLMPRGRSLACSVGSSLPASTYIKCQQGYTQSHYQTPTRSNDQHVHLLE